MRALKFTRCRPHAAAFALSSAFAIASPSPARAEDPTARCIAEHESSQALRRAGKLREARKMLLGCGSQECPAIVRADCGTWLGEVEASLPTLVVAARDAATGLDVVDARVSIDGELAADRLDGKAVQVDPGEHTVRIVRRGSPPLESRVVMREGEHNRQVSFSFVDALTSRSTPSRTLPLVFGGIGVLGLGSFTGFAVAGRQRYDHDLRACATMPGGCSSGEIDAVRARLVVADVSLGVAVVSLGLATYLWFSTRAPAPAAARSARAPASPPWWTGRF